MRYLLLAILALTLIVPACAQAPGGRSASSDGGTVMINTAKGLFVLRAGVLGKFALPTLQQQQMLQLFGPAPERPGQGADRTAWQAYMQEMSRRTAGPLMFVKDNSLIIIIGDGFARINQDTLKTEAAQDLKTLDATADANQPGFRMPEPAPAYLLVDNTLYLMRTKEVLALNITDGKIISRSPLPKELQSAQGNGYRGNGGGNPGGGNRGGGAGNGGGGAAPAN